MIAAVLGWVGTIGCFVTYVMASRGHWAVSSVRYSSLNAVGGILGGTASALYGAWPSAVANFAWAVVAMHALSLHLYRRLRKSVSLNTMTASESSTGDHLMKAAGCDGHLDRQLHGRPVVGLTRPARPIVIEIGSPRVQLR